LWPRLRSRVSNSHHHTDRALSAGRRRRCHGARRRGEACGCAGPAGGGGYNRAGGSGLVGTRAFIKSPPNGYTLVLGPPGSVSSNPSLYTNAGFDPRKDFAPIGLIASMPVVLLAHPSFPAKTIGEVVAIARSAGTNFNIGTSAVGTGGYLTAELFKS